MQTDPTAATTLSKQNNMDVFGNQRLDESMFKLDIHDPESSTASIYVRIY
jgi:hypothetical protein